MKKLLTIILLFFISLAAMAQLEVKPGSFKEVPGFVNLNPDPDYQTDDNDLPLSVIKVKTENIDDKQRRNLRFEGNLATYIVIEYKVGEVWLYVTSKYADYLKISHPDLSSTEFTIPMDLMPKKGYEMTLVNKTAKQTQTSFSFGALSISTPSVEGASIKINNVPIIEKTPCQISTFPAGTYTITVYKESYNTVSKTVEVVPDQKTDVEFNLKHIAHDSFANTTVNTTINLDDIDNEGMWLPMYIDRLNYIDMQKMGLQLTSDELYSINHNSLKDAVVGLSNSGAKPRGFFCTGEIVSKNSLLFTNHHCGYNSIAALSTVEHDWLNEGFWAKNYSEELPAEGLTATFLVRMEDVTSQVLSAVNNNMDYQARTAAINAKIKELENAASQGGKLNPVIKSFFEGNEYYMFVYKTYTDVRLVGTPPRSIGSFGGDTDNWMWPRETADFSVFRVYGDRNGEPADYSPNNKPLASKEHLTISLDGVHENDFTMILGYPASTQRYMTSYGVNYNVTKFYPLVYDIFKAETDVMDKYMNIDQSVYIAYANDRASLSNTWKNFAGQMTMLRKNKVVERKVEIENQFTNWVNAKYNRKREYGYVLDSLEYYYDRLGTMCNSIYCPSMIVASEVLHIASKFSYYHNNPTNASALNDIDVDKLYKNFDPRVGKDVLAAVLKVYGGVFNKNDIPEELQKILKKHNGNWESLANSAFDNSMFGNPYTVKAFLKHPDAKKLSKDPVFVIYNALWNQAILNSPVYRKYQNKIEEYKHIYMKGLREFYAETQPNKVLYPDANSTMRLTYGPVKSYVTQEGRAYNYYTTGDDLLKKYIPGDYEFDAPVDFVNLLKSKDFGRYANESDELPLCFLSKTDIIGGCSGSPVINGNGELIGIAFDGNWEAVSGDIMFEPKLQRTICLDIRYALFIIDKYSGAKNIINELDIRD